MQNKQTYFEQVPLDAIKKIVEEESRRPSKVEKPANAKVEAVEEEPLLEATEDRSEEIL
jgi:hypothetical protein